MAGLGGRGERYKWMGVVSLEVRASRLTEGLSSEVKSWGEVGETGREAGKNPKSVLDMPA